MIYVDDLKVQKPSNARVARAGARHGHRWCHLMADSEEELHRFAASIGMQRDWFHRDHYDLTPPRRALALGLGAKEVTSRQLVGLRQLLLAFKS